MRRCKGGRRKRTRKPDFTPSDKQLAEAKRLIVRTLKRGMLYACNAKDAVYQLLHRAGQLGKQLGRTAQEKAITVHRALADLVHTGKVLVIPEGYRLAAAMRRVA